MLNIVPINFKTIIINIAVTISTTWDAEKHDIPCLCRSGGTMRNIKAVTCRWSISGKLKFVLQNGRRQANGREEKLLVDLLRFSEKNAS